MCAAYNGKLYSTEKVGRPSQARPDQEQKVQVNFLLPMLAVAVFPLLCYCVFSVPIQMETKHTRTKMIRIRGRNEY